ncbi:amidase family protein [Streptomyces sp. C11-1]|uniref:Amidase family protein n=1 Tax=Streptomyces durocortorensis TaxID=2811104 RepID=A0ABY9W086_9ACTN|nr:amidase family protein [Streptomyces durocortorensis]WNF29561.1 amidase family protein [Streptomyces durocortorensis]
MTRTTRTPSAVARALERIGRLDPALNAFIEVWPDEALAREPEARELPLGGLPFAVKGPAGVRSYAARRLFAAGGVPVGATSVPGPGTVWQTWGQGAHGRTVNPWRADRTPGGSSAGSAVAVAAGMAELATGSDGAGSVRIPAAWCGVFGLKTTNGLLPSPDRSGLASAGVLARSAAGAERYLRHVLDGYEPPAAPPLPLPAVYSEGLGFADVDPEVAAVVRAAVDRLVAAGTVRLLDTGCELLDPARAWQAVRGGAPGDPGAVAVRRANDDRLDALFAAAPLLLTPVTPNRPHGHEGPGDLYSTALTWVFNLSGHPAASLPAGFTGDGCPVGLQLVAARGADVSLLGMAHAVESVLPTVRS